MIITHLIAENVLKYRKLELVDLPRQGLITICGENESGKSSIGETICFALFGRTFSIGDGDLSRVICWGESRCSVELGFEAGGKDYVVERFLDDEGNHGARLFPAGQRDLLLAKGTAAVAGALEEIIGYRFNEFVESFYLAQREITTPHPHSHAVKAMAGIYPLERVGDLLKGEVDDARDELQAVTGQLENVVADIEKLGVDPKKLDSLESQMLAVGGAGKVLRGKEHDLGSASSEYQAALESLASARRSRKIWRISTGMAFLAAIVLAVAWYVLSKTPDSVLATRISGILTWGDRPVGQLGLASGTGGALAIALLLAGGRGTRRIASLIRSGETLADLVKASGRPVPGISAEVELVDEGSELDALRACRLDAPGAAALVSSAKARIARMLAAQREEKAKISALIDAEKALHAKADALGGVADSLREKIDGARRTIQVREVAAELIKGASRHVSQRFNRDLRDLASGTLPLLTEGRYEHLRIDTDLEVQVFSSQKRDFMDLDEISSGTQRQIMLAVRLALSQELVNTTGTKKQFLFLDEPFAFFDPARTRNAMAALPDLSDEICQIWVIAQEFPEDTERDLAIECNREIERINDDGGDHVEESKVAEGEEDPKDAGGEEM